MLRSMLVAVDGSPFAEAALNLGIRLAKRFDCQLAAVGVIDEPTIRGPQGTPVGGTAFKIELDDSRVESATTLVEHFLARVAIRCSEEGVSSKLLEDVGWPHEEILRELQRYDLLLIGRETYFHFEMQKTSGETLHKILHHTPRPVIAVPDEFREGKNVVIGFDGSVQAARAVQACLATGLYDLGEVHVVSIHSKDKVKAAKTAERAVDFLGFHQIKARPHAIKSSEPAGDVLLEQARLHDAAMLVMGCYGQSRLREFFLGSVTNRVIERADVPLFFFH